MAKQLRRGLSLGGVTLAFAILWVGVTQAQENPFARATAKEFAGAFKANDSALRLEVDGLKVAGRLLIKGKHFTITGTVAKGVLTGEFQAGGKSWAFTCSRARDGGLDFVTGGDTTRFKKVTLGRLAGRWAGEAVELTLEKGGSGYTGKLNFQGKEYRLEGKLAALGVLPAEFIAGEQRFPCKLTLDLDGFLRFSSGGYVARLHRIAARHGALADLRLWNATGKEAQDALIQSVAKRLAEDYVFVRTALFSCGDLSCRIATFRHKASGLELNLVPGGIYRMGSEKASSDEKPVHFVAIEPLLIGRVEVSQAAWDKIGGEDKRRWQGDKRPMEGVSWNEVMVWLSKAGGGLRLLSESEWEYAARAGAPSGWCFGDEEGRLNEFAWFNGNAGEATHPVGAKTASAFGLHDMHGNVWEWCLDHWHDSYQGAPTNGAAWVKGGDSAERVYRGGSWKLGAGGTRSHYRYGGATSHRSDDLGFRVARSLD